jgi:hypothetical protein
MSINAFFIKNNLAHSMPANEEIELQAFAIRRDRSAGSRPESLQIARRSGRLIAGRRVVHDEARQTALFSVARGRL